jgi:hypothetical protein
LFLDPIGRFLNSSFPIEIAGVLQGAYLDLLDEREQISSKLEEVHVHILEHPRKTPMSRRSVEAKKKKKKLRIHHHRLREFDGWWCKNVPAQILHHVF